MSKADWVTEQLRELIVSGELEPGSVLRQRQLATRFGVSPTPVREALQRLETEGFITGELHHSATVVRAEVSRLYENALIRASLESLAARLATARISEERIEELRRIAAEFETASQDSEEATALNRELHFKIYEAAESRSLYRMLEGLWQTLRLGPQIFRPHAESVAQHAAIIDALEAGDSERAAELTKAHVEEAAQQMLDARGQRAS